MITRKFLHALKVAALLEHQVETMIGSIYYYYYCYYYCCYCYCCYCCYYCYCYCCYSCYYYY